MNAVSTTGRNALYVGTGLRRLVVPKQRTNSACDITIANNAPMLKERSYGSITAKNQSQ